MPPARCDRLNRAWMALVVLTLLSLAAGRAGWTGLLADGAVLAVALVKARQVLMHFLGLRSAPSGWRAAFMAWLLAIAGAALIAAAVPALHA